MSKLVLKVKNRHLKNSGVLSTKGGSDFSGVTNFTEKLNKLKELIHFKGSLSTSVLCAPILLRRPFSGAAKMTA